MVGAALLGYVIIALQKLFFTLIAGQQGSETFVATARAMHHTWVINLPIAILIGSALIWQGTRMRKAMPGSGEAVIAVLFTAVIALGSYFFDLWRLAPVIEAQFATMPVLPVSPHSYMLFSFAGTAVMTVVPLLGFATWVWLARPRAAVS